MKYYVNFSRHIWADLSKIHLKFNHMLTTALWKLHICQVDLNDLTIQCKYTCLRSDVFHVYKIIFELHKHISTYLGYA